MKRFTFLPLLFLCVFAFGQKQIVVQGGTAQSFETLTEAIDAASAGDTIYIPGGGFTTPATIEKQLHWRGVGHYPDSTSATGFTQITTGPIFNGNCDGSTFEGIYFSTTVSFGTSDTDVTGVSIRKCRLANLNLRNNSNSVQNKNISFQMQGCVTGNIYAYGASGCLIENNLIFGSLNNFNQCLFKHNIICADKSYSRVINYCINCQFRNNVFAYDYGLHYSENCNFINNIFQGGHPFDSQTSQHTRSNNLFYTGVANLFSSLDSDIRTFSYKNDYHLGTAKGTDEDGNTDISLSGKATDGTNPGIYGGSVVKQYKEGAFPYSPHIRSVTIANEAVNGELDVKVIVAAQEK